MFSSIGVVRITVILGSAHLHVVSAATRSGQWLAPDRYRLGMALGHVASNGTEAINDFLHNHQSPL